MALSKEFLSSPRFQSQNTRRIFVLLIALWTLDGMVHADEHIRLQTFTWYIVPLCILWGWYRRGKTIRLSTLDDHAMLECGRLFDELDAKEQSAILDSYRGGTQVRNVAVDERDRLLRAKALEQANAALRVVLPLQALACAAFLYWGHANVFLLLAWLVIVALSMPQLAMMWTAPNEVREMHPVPPMAQTEREL